MIVFPKNGPAGHNRFYFFDYPYYPADFTGDYEDKVTENAFAVFRFVREVMIVKRPYVQGPEPTGTSETLR